jgi:hypothetical protein
MLITLALADARAAQGAFDDAATLAETATHPHDPAPEFRWLNVAFYAYLGRDLDRARAALGEMDRAAALAGHAAHVTPLYHPVLAYLRYTLADGPDPRPVIRRATAALAEWDEVVTRHQADPYGAAVRELLAAMRALVAPRPA